MSKNIQEALLDLKARQEAGEKMPCPRCGRDTMKPDLYTNALSRHANGIYVCDDCGTAEAMLDFMRNPLPLECWAQFREDEATADFKAVPGEEALKTIKAEHVPRPDPDLPTVEGGHRFQSPPDRGDEGMPRPDTDLG
jgi:predicted RNA-binding Zn-ribbon protein involved in translation (DUF1610 family)